MKSKLLFILFFCFVCSASAQTQSDLNESAAADFHKADRELNNIYQQIIKKNKEDTAFTRNLKTAQRLWVQFRDAEMLMKYPDREPGYYGSIFPLCWSNYLTELTYERIKTLKKWTVGEVEGDACGGTVPIKE